MTTLLVCFGGVELRGLQSKNFDSKKNEKQHNKYYGEKRGGDSEGWEGKCSVNTCCSLPKAEQHGKQP